MIFHYNLGKDNIVTITLNMNDKSVNIINKHFFDSFQDVIDRLKNEKNLKE